VKPNTIQEHQKRINMVIDYISNHLDDKLDIIKLSNISAISPYHFHRIMSAYLGEPIGSYIIRCRIEASSTLLKYSSHQIDEIAYKIGYDSPTSYTKAFKKHFGISPTEFRNSNNSLTMKTIIVDKVLPVGFKLKPKIVERVTKKMIYIRLIGDYKSNDYSQAWEKIWLPESNCELRDAPCFEKNIKFSKTNPDKNKTEVYIPIK
jgi:AraC family transcriptional regulator